MAAIGGGLLVGVNRERQRALNPEHEPASERSNTLVALIGAVAGLCGDISVAVGGVGVAALVATSYWHSSRHDAGVTTELALFASFLLGVLCQAHPAMGAALIVVPLLPDKAFDPWGVLNPRQLWLLAVLVMTINALGYVALRALGGRLGLPLAGFLGGFISSSATIAGMGQRARTHDAMVLAYEAAALLSCVATVLEMAAILWLVAPRLLWSAALPLTAAGIAAITVAGACLWPTQSGADSSGGVPAGRAFALPQALHFGLIVAMALLMSRLLQTWLGYGSTLAVAAAAGLADVHAATVAVGQRDGAYGFAGD